MKVSVNWMQQLAGDVKILPKGRIDELVEKIGAQLGAVEEVIDLGKSYQGIVVAKVVSCEKHPDADKLSLCRIDDGGATKNVERDKDGLVQVVCGAPNVRAGLLVAWLPPGTAVPRSADKEPFVLEARDIRGKVSNGMLASAHELAISDDHSGILEITEDAKPGDDFAKSFGLDDYIIDIENKMFTHRPDLFGQLGVAREIAGITGQQFTSPKSYTDLKPAGKAALKLTVKNDAPDQVPRLMAQIFSGIEVKPSPLWLQSYLTRVGIRPINNIVDLTNYFMMLTGQPMHAYDYDKLSGSLEARMSRKGDKITLLNGKQITFDDDAHILITSKDVPIGIGGVMGGGDSEVDDDTKNIVLECASFDMYTIRRTSMRYGLFTDAVTRFNKGQSPWQSDHILAWAGEELAKLGATAEAVYDEQGKMTKSQTVRVEVKFVNDRLGLDLSADDMQKLLENVEIGVERTDNKNELKVTGPFWRTDIEIPEDVVEEIGRLYGYDHLPLVLPRRDLTPSQKDPVILLKQRIREVLSKAGANEVLTYSFVHGNLLDRVGQDKAQAYELSNALSPDLQYYRMSLTPSLLDKVHMNVKSGYGEFALFELGKAHNKSQADSDEHQLPKEFQMLSFVITSSDIKAERSKAAYFSARKQLDFLALSLGVQLTYKSIEQQEHYEVAKPFDFKRSASVWLGDTPLGMVGEYHPTVMKNLKLPRFSAGFEIGLEQLMMSIPTGIAYRPIPRYPKVTQDITLRLPADMMYANVYNFVYDNLDWPEHTQPQLEPIDIYQGDDKSTKNITLRFTIASYEKTMTDAEVNSMLDAVAAKAQDSLGAERI